MATGEDMEAFLRILAMVAAFYVIIRIGIILM